MDVKTLDAKIDRTRQQLTLAAEGQKDLNAGLRKLTEAMNQLPPQLQVMSDLMNRLQEQQARLIAITRATLNCCTEAGVFTHDQFERERLRSIAALDQEVDREPEL